MLAVCLLCAGCHDPPVPAPQPAADAGPVAVQPGVRLTGMLSSAGWIIQIHLPEPATTIWYRRAGEAEPTPTGALHGAFEPTSGQAMPKPYVVLDGLQGRVPLEIRYQNAHGQMRGPYQLEFDTVEQGVASVKSVLADLPAWVSFRDWQGQRLVYFTTLVTYKYALTEIRYGFDGDPDRTVRFAPSDTLGIAADDELYTSLPAHVEAVSVQLTFRDGSRSEIKRSVVPRELPP